MPMDPLSSNAAGDTVRYIAFRAIKFVLPMVTDAALYRYFTIIQNQKKNINVNTWRLEKITPLDPNDAEYERKVVSPDYENWEIIAYIPADDIKHLKSEGFIAFMFWRLKVDYNPGYDPPGFWFVDRRVGNF